MDTYELDRRTLLELAGALSLPAVAGEADGDAASVDPATARQDDGGSAPGEWTHDRYGPARRGYNPTAVGPSSEANVAWQFSENDSPVLDSRYVRIYDGTVYSQRFGGGEMIPLDLTTGRRGEPFDVSATESGATRIGAHTIADGTAYVLYKSAPEMAAYDLPSGEERWRRTAALGGTYRAGQGGISVTGGRVLVQERTSREDDDGDRTVLFAHDADDGQEQWRRRIPLGRNTDGKSGLGVVSESAGFLVRRESVTDDRSRAQMTGIDLSNGEQRWQVPPGTTNELLGDSLRFYELTPALLAADGAVVTTRTAISAETVKLIGFEAATGAVRWQQTFDNYDGSDHTMAVADDTAIYLPIAGSVRAVSLADGTTRWAVSREALPGAEYDLRSLALVDGALFGVSSPLNGDPVTLFALDPVDGSVRWRRGTGAQPSVYPAAEFLVTIDGREDAVVTYRGAPLTVSVPDQQRVVAGKAYEFEVDLGNATEDPLTNVGLELEDAEFIASSSVSGVPDRLGPEETATVTVEYRLAELFEQTTPVKVTGSADGISDVVRPIEFDVRSGVDVTTYDSATDRTALAEGTAKVTLDVRANEFETVSGVAVAPRFDEMEGGWAINNPLQDLDAVVHDGGDWTPDEVPPVGGANVWVKPEMAPEGRQLPGLKMSVPDLPPGEYELPIDAYIKLYEGSNRVKAVETTADITVEENYLFLNLTGPAGEVGGGDDADVAIAAEVLSASVEDPTITVGGVPDGFVVEGGTAAGGTFTGDGTPTFRWTGSYEEGTELTGTLRFTSPKGAEAGGSYEVAASLAADVPEADESRSDGATGRIEVSGLPGRIAQKNTKAARIDDITRYTSGEFDLVSSTLETLEARANDDGGAPTLDQAERAVNRMYLGERLADRSLAIGFGVERNDPTTFTTEYDLVRPTAEQAMSMAGAFITSAVKLVPVVLKLLPVSVGTPRVLRGAARWADKWLSGNLGGLFSYSQHLDSIAKAYGYEYPEIDVPGLDAAQAEIRSTTGIDPPGVGEVLADVVETLTEGLVNYMRAGFEGSVKTDLEDLTEGLSPNAIASSGLAGDRTAAGASYGNAVRGLEGRGELAAGALREFSSGIGPVIKEIHGTIAEIYAALPADSTGQADIGVWDIVDLLRDMFDLVQTFFTGGAVSAYIGVVAIESINQLRAAGIEGIRTGTEFQPPSL